MIEEKRRIFVIVGLGNPGMQYAQTRHNAGFMVVRTLAKRWGIALKEQRRIPAVVGKGRVGEMTVHLMMPTTYMNESGRAVRQYLDYHKLSVEDLFVVVDDVAIPFGTMRLRLSGSSGGHNGLKSVEQYLGTQNYLRLRVGIGDREKGTLVDHVLGGFSKAQRRQLPLIIGQGADVMERLCQEDVASVMQDVNIRNKEPREMRQEKENGRKEEQSL